MSARYILRRSGTQFYWNFFAVNGEIILTSERYVSKQGAEGGIASCRTHSPHDQYYARLTSTAAQPYFTLRAANYEPIGASEMYSSIAAREAGIVSCKANGPSAPTVDQT